MKFDPMFSLLLAGQDLTASESDGVFTALFKEKLSPQKAKSLLLLLARKGESVPELFGCLQALRRLEPPIHTSMPLLDTCGTGGDGSNSINISTLAALVIAGAGGRVAKHGNSSISSRCGSSDVLKELGVRLSASRKQVLRSIQKNGIGYFHAPAHHPVFSKTLRFRKDLKIKTIFNLLGPLANPACLQSRLVGVASKKIFNTYISLMQKEKGTALICYSREFDEISAHQPTEAALIRKGKVTRFTINPKTLLPPARGSVRGGDARKNAEIALKILNGKIHGRASQTVLINAAAGLWVSGKAQNLRQGLELAEKSLSSGKALQALRGLIRDSR